MYRVGLTGIPIFNINNNCATGSSALYLARQAVATGAVQCAIVVGFEQMNPGALRGVYDDRPSPISRFLQQMTELQGFEKDTPRAAQFFGGTARDYMKQYDIRPETFAHITVKARRTSEERRVGRVGLAMSSGHG